jgi:hypothetical protein
MNKNDCSICVGSLRELAARPIGRNTGVMLTVDEAQLAKAPRDAAVTQGWRA